MKQNKEKLTEKHKILMKNLIQIIPLSKFTLVILMALSLSVLSCKNSDKSSDDVSSAKAAFVAEKNLVDTVLLKRQDFNREIISNGKLVATQRAELKFTNSGVIERVYVSNGSYVTKGSKLVQLNEKEFAVKLSEAQINLEKAELDFKDDLISYGYGTDTISLPAEQLKMAKIRSGYSAAKQSYITAKDNLASATLLAPFNGVIANLEAKPYEMSGDIVCLVLDNSKFDVEFKLVESELAFIKEGQKVKISPFIDATALYSGVIKSINPLVDENGQVIVTATVDNKGKKLVDGMNVKVFIESLTKDQLVVPKSAIVIRDGYDVLFTYDAERGRAGWVYVDVLLSNSSQHVVRGNQAKNAELNEGSYIIVSGNLNLASDSEVEIR